MSSSLSLSSSSRIYPLTRASFQQVQGASALKASLQVVPSLLAGALTSIATGIFVHRMPVLWMLLVSSAMSTVAPLLMALVRTNQLYWENAFFAQVIDNQYLTYHIQIASRYLHTSTNYSPSAPTPFWVTNTISII